jgi:hypothetical protein
MGWNRVMPEVMRSFFADFRAWNAGLPFPILSDKHSQWINALGAMKTPHSYIIEARTGNVLYQGGIDDSTHPDRASRFHLAEAIEDLKAGKSPRVSQTRALGCQIKRN